MPEKVLICALAGWLLLIYVIRIYKRDEGIRKRRSGKMSWYEYLMSLSVDELGKFLASHDELSLQYCNKTFCPHFGDGVDCVALNRWYDGGQKADEYPCGVACKKWLNSEKGDE